MNKAFCLVAVFIITFLVRSNGQGQLPHLAKVGNRTQLIVQDQPFLVLGGELGNSTATTMENMEPVWPRLKAMNLNTVLVPVYWELIEAEEGRFDFSLYEALIKEARKNNLKIIFLWFGAWKNSMSSHAPAWIKRNQQKYPRVKDEKGKSLEILSSFSKDVLDADIKAFEQLMTFIKTVDQQYQTVVMIQPENEIGMLSSARDYHPLAEEAFKTNVPAEVISYLQKKKDQLVPELQNAWKQAGSKTKGNWQELFGKGLYTDELFMAYYYSVFMNKLIAAGKKIYPLPMFVNAALNRPGKLPGEYPSAGPLPHLMDVWKAGGTAIDFLSPDFYNPDFKHWNDLYTRQGDPLFIPEHAFDATVAAKALFTFANYEGIGFSPFSIESNHSESLGKMYALIRSLTPLITSNKGKNKIKGVLLTKTNQDTVITIGNYEFKCKHDYTLSWTPGSRTDDWPYASAMIIQTGEDEFYVAGTGVVITFSNSKNKNQNVGLLKVDEGIFDNNVWKVIRHLNGDQTHQGRHVNIPTNQIAIQKVTLYNYD
ncbi:GH35 family beta-galactosidase [Lacibacter sp. H407]|uniref:GH35 family beta-galactosidase n=1 Tax=Lacibacter sp. H407 TaxID=3133423 RepID=UPI0030C2FEB1